MISLSDDELRTVMSAAARLHPRQRDQFLRDGIAELGKYPEFGPGNISRVCAKLQRAHLTPRMGHIVSSKYGH